MSVTIQQKEKQLPFHSTIQPQDVSATAAAAAAAVAFAVMAGRKLIRKDAADKARREAVYSG